MAKATIASVIKANPGTVDSYGLDLATELAAARVAQANHESVTVVNGHLRATVGRFWYSTRRWSWGFRFCPADVAGVSVLEGGTIFQVVERI